MAGARTPARRTHGDEDGDGHGAAGSSAKLEGIVVVDVCEVSWGAAATELNFWTMYERPSRDRMRLNVGGVDASEDALTRLRGFDFCTPAVASDARFSRLTRIATYQKVINEQTRPPYPGWCVQFSRRKKVSADNATPFLLISFQEYNDGILPVPEEGDSNWATIPWVFARATKEITLGRTDDVGCDYQRELDTFRTHLAAYNRMCSPFGLLKDRIKFGTGRVEDMLPPEEMIRCREQIGNLVFTGFEDPRVWPIGITLNDLVSALDKE